MGFRSNIGEFEIAVLAAEDTAKRQLVTVHKKIILEALSRVVKKTPVDTGRARGNWQVTIGSPATGTLDIKDRKRRKPGTPAPRTATRDAAAAQERALATISSLQPFASVWISNNLDYIIYLENGSSKQAPNGMLSVTVEELRAMFE